MAEDKKIIKKVFQILLYMIIQIIFIPFAIIGLIVGVYKEFTLSKKLGVSYSAGQTLQYRWYMHYFDTRPDPLTIAFTKKYPCESHFGLWTTMGAFIISQKLFGFRTKFGKLPNPGEETLDTTAAVRVLTFDNILKKYINEVDQVVLPGVGFDLIALHFTKDKGVKVFEVDQTNTINIKKETLKKANIDHDWVNYIPVDYEKESWSEKLLASGFDITKKTLFLWQSVSHFLDEELVKDCLKEMSSLCAEGSIIAQDFYSKAFVFNDTSMPVKSQKNLMKKMGEEWKFGIDMSENPKGSAEKFLKDCNLKMTQFMQFGEKLDIEPFYCIVEAEKL